MKMTLENFATIIMVTGLSSQILTTQSFATKSVQQIQGIPAGQNQSKVLRHVARS